LATGERIVFDHAPVALAQWAIALANGDVNHVLKRAGYMPGFELEQMSLQDLTDAKCNEVSGDVGAPVADATVGDPVNPFTKSMMRMSEIRAATAAIEASGIAATITVGPQPDIGPGAVIRYSQVDGSPEFPDSLIDRKKTRPMNWSRWPYAWRERWIREQVTPEKFSNGVPMREAAARLNVGLSNLNVRCTQWAKSPIPEGTIMRCGSRMSVRPNMFDVINLYLAKHRVERLPISEAV
jgi:hypothetical protein